MSRARIAPSAAVALLLVCGCGAEDTSEPLTLGSVRIKTAPDGLNPPWLLEGPGGFSVSDVGDSLLIQLEPGDYGVIWSPVDGWLSPDPQAATLDPGSEVQFDGTYERAPGAWGAIVVSPSPVELNPDWTVAGPGGIVEDGSGPTTITKMPLGEYLIEWGEVPGFVGPPDQVGTLEEGRDLTFTGIYWESTANSILVDPEPSHLQASWVLSGPNGFNEAGIGRAVFDDTSIGTYTVIWNDVEGWTTPLPEVLTLVAGERLEFSAVYSELPSETSVELRVSPSTLLAPWTIQGPGGFQEEGFGYRRFLNPSVGLYRVDWGEVLGWVAPNSETLTLGVGGQLQFQGAYEIAATGTVRIDATPDKINAPWELHGPSSAYSGSGTGDALLTDMVLGEYQLEWQDVPGWATPRDESLLLAEDDTIAFRGRYLQTLIIVDVEPDTILARWKVSGPDEFELVGSGDHRLDGIAPGRYKIDWGDDLYWTTPEDTSTYVDAGETVSFTGIYTQGSLAISSEPEYLNAGWVLTGDFGLKAMGTGPGSFMNLPPGSYEVVWDPMPGWLTPSSQRRQLRGGEKLQFLGVYRGGSIIVDTSPDSLLASWSLRGPSGFRLDGEGDRFLDNVAPGDYTMLWNAIDGWGTPLAESSEVVGGEFVTFEGRYIKPGWLHTQAGALMFDEVANQRGVVPPDGRGGPGNAVWHDTNTDGTWAISGGGGDGSERRITRDGSNTENLSFADIEIRWDHDPGNWGWWAYDYGVSARVPFGLYLVDHQSQKETRLIATFYANGGTEGTFDLSAETQDPYFRWPASDWCYANIAVDYDAFVEDASDGFVDSYDHLGPELFARLVFASPEGYLPQVGTVVRLSTIRAPGYLSPTGGLESGSIQALDARAEP